MNNNAMNNIEKPNFLVIIVDEQRYPPIYESNEIKEWRRNNLVAQELLRSNGIEFHRHYIGSTACCPSRTTLFTGHYPSLHGVSQTNGIAKNAFDPDMFWLNRNTVPTMGHYFQEAGYRTFYKGKWHISYEDIIIPGTHKSVQSYDPLTGVPNIETEELYLQANPLDDFGFAGWVGPEPHGENPRNSASSASIGVTGRDVIYAAEVVDLIESLDRQKRVDGYSQPWLMVASFVNPHDIVLYGALTAHHPMFNFAVEPMPQPGPPPTMYETLSTKPRCQASYRDIYPLALQPIFDQPAYSRLYYQLQENADQQILRVLEALIRSSFYDQTIVIFTSDHGDLLGSHGYLHQKWYCAYEEVIHVPLIIHNKHLFAQNKNVDNLTSHLDILPTMLGLANADVEEIQRNLQRKFSEARPFVGRDLSSSILGGECERIYKPIYFMTDDDVTRGLHQTNPLGIPYPSVMQPNHIETVMAHIRRDQNEELWKFSRYFDNDSMTKQDEYELYNLTADPLEIRNLAHVSLATDETNQIQRFMAALLEEERNQKRLMPNIPPGTP